MVILLTLMLDFDLTLNCEIECIRGGHIFVDCIYKAKTRQNF